MMRLAVLLSCRGVGLWGVCVLGSGVGAGCIIFGAPESSTRLLMCSSVAVLRSPPNGTLADVPAPLASARIPPTHRP